MAFPQQVILITGANRGIGFAIAQATALRQPKATYILACRSRTLGEEAVLELRRLGVTANLDVLELDVTNDATILAAKIYVEKNYGHLDVLVNNAGIGLIPKSNELSDIRENFNVTFNANITSVIAVTSVFLPLLHISTHPKIVNISSGRASLGRSTSGNLPPTAAVSYSVSKVALNALTIEMQKAENARDSESVKVEVYAANPGHCKTAFNGYRGTKDPLDGVEVVVQLVMAERGMFTPGSFLEFEEGNISIVPW